MHPIVHISFQTLSGVSFMWLLTLRHNSFFFLDVSALSSLLDTSFSQFSAVILPLLVITISARNLGGPPATGMLPFATFTGHWSPARATWVPAGQYTRGEPCSYVLSTSFVKLKVPSMSWGAGKKCLLNNVIMWPNSPVLVEQGWWGALIWQVWDQKSGTKYCPVQGFLYCLL